MSIIKKVISIVLCAIMVFSIIPICNIEAEATTTKTSTDAINWLKSKKGKALDYDGSYGAQCVDLIYYYYQYLGASVPGGNASDFVSNSKPSDWTRVKGGTPQKGDIIIYAGNGGYGHVAIYESDNSTWHQNFGDNQCVVNVSYNYKNIKAADGSGYWGYIRPDFEDGGATDSPKVTVDTSSDKYSITNTNAVLCGNIYNPFGAKVSKCGIKLYNEDGTLLKDFSNSISFTVSNVEIWFDINDELGYTLTRGTKYKYILYGVVDGKTYSTSTQTFTTKGGYTLSYNANGGSGAPSSQSGLIKYIISSTVPVRSGYTFLGWSTSNGAASATYFAGESITLTKNTTLYAVWEEIPVYNTYELVYNANGGTGAPSSQSGATSYIVSSTVPSRSGYTFLGWSTSSNATSATYFAGESITLTKNTTLYAVWEKTDLPANPEPDDDLDLSGFLTIRTPSVTKIDYGDSIVLHADLGSTALTGLKITWEASNDNFEIVSVSEDGRECVITPKKSGDTTFTATVEIGTVAYSTDTQVMTSNAGFFQKIIAFFKNLFGLTKTIPEVFKYAY